MALPVAISNYLTRCTQDHSANMISLRYDALNGNMSVPVTTWREIYDTVLCAMPLEHSSNRPALDFCRGGRSYEL
jgi:hypothetical protein